ncbi:hypothetical protein T484DRAFT_1864784 [Baffinella frigidus]|nr:hypothetical protein T484DRAFT_1864784 [Cryptophyta sp. CCMP2293]
MVQKAAEEGAVFAHALTPAAAYAIAHPAAAMVQKAGAEGAAVVEGAAAGVEGAGAPKAAGRDAVVRVKDAEIEKLEGAMGKMQEGRQIRALVRDRKAQAQLVDGTRALVRDRKAQAPDAQIAALQKQVPSLGAAEEAQDAQITALQKQVSSLGAEHEALSRPESVPASERADAQIAALQKQVSSLGAEQEAQVAAKATRAAAAAQADSAQSEAVAIAKSLLDMQERRSARAQEEQGQGGAQRRGIVGAATEPQGWAWESQGRARAFANIIQAAEAQEAQQGRNKLVARAFANIIQAAEAQEAQQV